MSLIIESLFTTGGTPNASLTPVFILWEIVGTTKTIVLNNISMVNAGDGFYLYEYTVGNGYDPSKTYTVHVDGGSSLPPNERYQTEIYTPLETTILNSDVLAIADAVWDETLTDHLIVGSTGESVNQIGADTQQLRLDTINLLNWVDQLLKYGHNRTFIDKVNKQLIIYDNNGTTVLKKFQLKDSNGIPSITEVTERLPI